MARRKMAEVILLERSDGLNTTQMKASEFDMEYDPEEQILHVTPLKMKNIRPWEVPLSRIREQSPMTREEAKSAAADRARATVTPIVTAPESATADEDDGEVAPAPVTGDVPGTVELTDAAGNLKKHKVTAKR